MRTEIRSRRRQRGAVLYISLVLLILLTLLGLASIGGTILQERMAGNYRVQQLAFQTAEERLRQTEREILGKLQRQETLDAKIEFDSGSITDPNSVEFWARRDPAQQMMSYVDVCAVASLCSLTDGTAGNNVTPDPVIQLSVASFDRPADPTSVSVLQSVFVP